MIDRLVLKYRILRIEKLQAKQEFLGNYRDIQVSRQNNKLLLANSRIEEAHQEKLRDFALRAGIMTKYIEQEINTLILKAETKYYWKKRALNQIMIRKAKTNKLDESQLEIIRNKKQIFLDDMLALQKQKITASFKEKAKDPEQPVALYENNSLLLDTFYEKKTQLVKDKYATKISKIETTKNHQLERIAKNIKTHKDLIAKLTKDMPKSDNGLPEDVILRLDKLTMRFGGLVAVDNLTFDVKKGEIFGLIGPNGAGKTTVFNCITKFYNPPSGCMYFRKNPVEVILLNEYPVHTIVKQGIVRTFQNVELIWELSVMDNLLVAAHSLFQTGFFGQLIHSRKLRQEEAVLRTKATGILAMLGLLPYQFGIPFGLPYGILKKIELARTLMVNPKMIILDEPAAGLNESETVELAKIIRKIRKEYNTTIFLVEHDMGLVMDVCDTICAISFGKQIAIGSPKEIQNNKIVRDAYLGEE